MNRFRLTQEFIKGPVQMLGSALFFAVMAYFVKLSALGGVPAAEIALVRFSVGIVVAFLLGAFGCVDLKASRKGLLVARGVFGGSAILLYFIALEQGTLTNATVLNNTYPIFATLASALLLKEMLGWSVGVSLGAAWTGVILLTHPDPRQLAISDLLGLTSGILGGIAVTIVRKLRQEGESAWSIFFYLSLFGWLASLILSLNHWVTPGLRAGFFMLLAAALGMVAQVMMTFAYRYCQTAVGGILSMTTMVFSTGFGVFFFKERLSPLEILGIILIILGSSWVVYRTERTSGKR